MAFPTGDGQGKNIAHHQPVDPGRHGRPVPDRGRRPARHHRPARPGEPPPRQSPHRPARAQLPHLPALERARSRASTSFPPDRWPDNIPLLYYSYHIMVGLGTICIAVMALAALSLWRGTLYQRAPAAVDADADAPLPLHRQHRRLDHRRSRPPALADLRPHAHRRRASRRTSPPATRSSPCSASWASTRPRDSLPLPGAPRNRTRSRDLPEALAAN